MQNKEMQNKDNTNMMKNMKERKTLNVNMQVCKNQPIHY